MNYIKIYENHTRHAVPVGYEIHHIDHDRENNEENYIGGFESFLKTNKVFEIYNEIYPF